MTTEDICDATKASAKETCGDMFKVGIGRLRSHDSGRRSESELFLESGIHYKLNF
jgi:hypothetical protein